MAVIRLAGIELYAVDLERSRDFYEQVLGREVSGKESEHHVMFSSGEAFLCLKPPGAEIYPSQDKALAFFVADLASVVDKNWPGPFRRVRGEAHWRLGGLTRSRRPQRAAASEEG